jgi:hypothetical protein
MVKGRHMKTMLAAILGFAALAVVHTLHMPTVAGQKEKKSWTEWSKKDAEKVLTSSPWAQTQVETDLTEMFYTPTSDNRGAPNSAARAQQGATNQEVNLSYHIRFFSARPIRQALARLYQIQRKPTGEELQGLESFANAVPAKVIILTVTYDSSDGRTAGRAMQLFGSAITATLKNKAYLERKDGTRVFLEEYVPPGKDGFGARFIFPRFFQERPFITDDAGEVRFFAEFTDAMKLNMRFSISQIKFNDQLEY